MLKGVVCGYDQTLQPFDVCITCHENLDPNRNCMAPTALLKAMRDNSKTRSNAGVSASTLLSCPRAVALQTMFDYYETPISGWNKFRGTLVHHLMEYDESPPDWIIKERRVERFIDVGGEAFRISGQMDYIDTKNKILIDFKTKPNLPRKMDERHEAQLNIYIFLLADGVFCDTGEIVHIPIERAGIHYLTFQTSPDKAWLKMGYPVWDAEAIQAFVLERAEPIAAWQRGGGIPACSPYAHNPRWKCDCTKIEEQLAQQGIEAYG